MKILYASGYAPWWGSYPPDVLDRDCERTVGGGEAGMLMSAFELVRYGHEVVVYSCAQPGIYRGVAFRDEKRLYQDLGDFEPDAVVAWSDPTPLRAFRERPEVARLLVQQLNDLLFAPGWEQDVDVLVSPSQNHADWMRSCGWTGSQAVMHNGETLSLFEDQRLPKDRPLRVGYWSSPDRGLHHVLRVWPRVKRAVPGATLRINYEVERLFDYADSVGGTRGQARIIEVRRAVLESRYDSSISYSGAIPRVRLAEEQKQTRIMAYPSDGIGYTEGYCSPPGTLVTTRSGFKPIEQITVQDEVLSHAGRYCSVTGVHLRQFEGILRRVVPACGQPVEFTPDHPVLVAPAAAAPSAPDGVVQQEDLVWHPAEQVQPGMWLHSATPRQTASDPAIDLPRRLISLARQQKGRVLAAAHGYLVHEIPALMGATPELCRLIGYFAGDGNASLRGRLCSTVSFSLGVNKQEWIDDCVSLLQRCFGLTARVHDARPRKQMLVVQIDSNALAFGLHRWCYAPDGRKWLPDWCMVLPEPFTVELLKGLWRTDGCVFRNRANRNARMAAFTTTSPYLAGQVQTLLSRIGYRVAAQRRRHETGTISFDLLLSAASTFLDYESKPVQEQYRSGYWTRQTTNGDRALRVRAVSERLYAGPVISIAVKDDESYTVGNFTAHNCIAALNACTAGCLPILRPVDALPSIYGDAARWLPRDTGSPEFDEALVGGIVQGLTDWADDPRDPTLDRLHEKAREYPWSRAGREMERAVRQALEIRRGVAEAPTAT